MKKMTHIMLVLLGASLNHGYPEYYDLTSAKEAFQTLPPAQYTNPFRTIPPKGPLSDYGIMERKYGNPFFVTRVPLDFQGLPITLDTLEYSNSELSGSGMSSFNSSYSENQLALGNFFPSLWRETDALANTALNYTSNWLRDTWNNLDTFEGYKSRMSQALIGLKDIAGEFLNKMNDKRTEWSNWVYERLADPNRSNSELLEKIRLLEQEIAALRLRQPLSTDNDPEWTYPEPRYLDEEINAILLESDRAKQNDSELDQTRRIRS